MKSIGWILCCVLAVPASALAQSDTRPVPATPPPAQDAGPTVPHTKLHVSGEVYIGERAPDFELDASNGHSLLLSSTRGDWVLLVFDDRKESLHDLKAKADEARSLGVKMIGVCDEKAYVLKGWADREQMPFLLLADPTGEISAMYGLYDGERSTTGPGFVLVDRGGIVRMALLGQRLPADDILRLARFAVTGS